MERQSDCEYFNESLEMTRSSADVREPIADSKDLDTAPMSGSYTQPIRLHARLGAEIGKP